MALKNTIAAAALSGAMVVLLALFSVTGWSSGLKRDERVLFFPTSAAMTADGLGWQVPVHGWVFEQEADSLWRQGSLALLHEALEIDESALGSQLFRQRAWSFIVDNERGKRLAVQLNGQRLALPASGANGHIIAQLPLQMAPAEQAVGAPLWYPLQLLMPEGDPRRFGGAVQFVPPRGFSVISDIDDTIKQSNVLDKHELLANTFLRDYRAVPGMSELYQAWAEQGAAFHYVTGSPWQLYEPLSQFMAAERFPRGSFTMRDFRLKDSTFFNLFASAESYKIPAIEALFQAYPQRHFVLVGDSGEKDPEVYAQVAQRHPGQVVAVLIRNVTAARLDDERFAPLLHAAPQAGWQLFEHVQGVELLLHAR